MSKSPISIFDFNSYQIRTIIKNTELWFIANDITQALDYSNSRKAILDHVDEEDKSAVTIRDSSQNRVVNIINESGMYSLVLKSRKPKARSFKRWVTSEVLPSIRKTGKYHVQKEAPLVIGEVKQVEYPYLLKFEELHDCGWSMEINKLLHALKANEGKEIIIKPGAIARSMSEVRTLMHLTESYRAKLQRIQSISKF